jgi:hypothetical protein
MKLALASRKSALAAALALAIAAVSAGCATGTTSATPTPAASHSSAPVPAPSRIPLATGSPGGHAGAALASILPSLITCMKAQGMTLPSGSPTGKQVRQAFRTLPLASQQRIFAACEYLLPEAARQVVIRDLAEEKDLAK